MVATYILKINNTSALCKLCATTRTGMAPLHTALHLLVLLIFISIAFKYIAQSSPFSVKLKWPLANHILLYFKGTFVSEERSYWALAPDYHTSL